MELMQAIKGRRSVRAYTDEPVSRAEILSLIEAAAASPSAMNLQPWSFVVVEGKERLERMSALAKRALLSLPTTDASHRTVLQDPSHNIFYGAPCLIIVCARPPSRQAAEDCCLAAHGLMLAAYSRGWGTCWIGTARPWLELPQTRSLLGLLPDQVPVAPVIVGKPASVSPPTTRHKPVVLWPAV